jgi:transcriptional regulator with XRE-family HTH domain
VTTLRQMRRNRGLLLSEVAEHVDITTSYLSLIERGERVPSPPVAKRLADFYGHVVTDLWPEELAA